MIRKKHVSNRRLAEALISLKQLRSYKRSLKESYLRTNKFESCSLRERKMLESDYSEECNELIDCNREILADCMEIPEAEKCLRDVCDEDGCVFDDCYEEEFDTALDNAIECLAFLVIPTKIRC